MRRLPLSDQLPYRFYPPSVNPFWNVVGGRVFRRMLRREQRIVEVQFEKEDLLRELVDRNDSVLITPNHSDNADSGIAFELSRRVGRRFYYMAAYQIFTGRARYMLPRVGAFPVDREGTDLKALKTAFEILSRTPHPLVIFPEGEIYRTNDRLTPLRDGAAAVALGAARKVESPRKTWVVPVAFKYRYLDPAAAVSEIARRMGELERQLHWWPQDRMPLLERIYRYAEGAVALKELDYLGTSGSGPLPARLAELQQTVLGRLEDAHLGKRSSDTIPVRVKELRRACLDRLARPDNSPDFVSELRHALFDIHTVVQLYSYPGDYVRGGPTVERAAEVLLKLEEDALHSDLPTPPGLRRATVRVGQPIDVAEFTSPGLKARHAAPALTNRLESAIQSLLDELGPGSPLPGSETPVPALEGGSDG